MVNSTNILLVLVIFAVFSAEVTLGYSHSYYMNCSKGCKNLRGAKAKALCYAACMAKAATMPDDDKRTFHELPLMEQKYGPGR